MGVFEGMGLQFIPLLGLTAYFLYLTYYYAAPMFRLKVMLFYAHIRYPVTEIRFTGGKITVGLVCDGAERTLERPIDIDPSSRFLAMTVCAEFGSLLREIGRGGAAAEEGEHGLSTGEGARGARGQGAEADRGRDGAADAGRHLCDDLSVPLTGEAPRTEGRSAAGVRRGAAEERKSAGES